METDCELLWVEITFCSIKSLIGVFYRSPNPPRNSLSQLEYSISSIPSTSTVVLCGDFNLPNINWATMSCTVSSSDGKKLCEVTLDHSLSQLVTEPTRQGNILDLLFTNNADHVHDVEVVDGLPGGDHDAVHFVYEVGNPVLSRAKRKVYNFKKANFDHFRDLLAMIPWDCCLSGNSIEDLWSSFKDLLFSAADQCIPKVTLRPRKSKHWLSKTTLYMIRKKKRAFKLAKRTKKDNDLGRYKVISNKVRDLTRRDHRKHLEEITMDLEHNQRPFWRWLKNMRCHCPGIPDLHYQGNTLTSALEKAKALNVHFSSVFTLEDEAYLDDLQSELATSRSGVQIDEIVISEDEVYDELCKIDPNKASGPDGIPGRLLKEGAPWLAKPLSTLFGASLRFGCLPSDWTSANVTPIFKQGSKHSPLNYRPISLTSLVVKLLERVIQRKLVIFLTIHHKLNPSQHGFRNGHSCQTQLIETVHKWAESLDHGLSTHVVFLDFSKAFDKVPH